MVKPSICLETKVRFLKGVGPKMANRLGRAGIETVRDLINYFPFRYDNFSLASSLNALQEGETATVKGIITEIKNEYSRHGKKIQKAILSDQSGKINVVWFNQPFLAKTLTGQKTVSLAGKITRDGPRLTMVSPQYEIFNQADGQNAYRLIHTGRLVPVYPETATLTSKFIRKLIAQALPLVKEQIGETLPTSILVKYNLLTRKDAYEKIHFPESKTSAEKARFRLAFEEVLPLFLLALKRKNRWQQLKKAPIFPLAKNKIGKLQEAFVKSLPFELTRSQKQVIDEVVSDLTRSYPMNRLLQGDVGSGKTVVAAVAAYLTAMAGYQTILMAPTEILAFQHYQTFKNLLQPMNLTVRLVTRSNHGRVTAKTNIIIGTHALLHRKISLAKLGFLVVDEEQRFGVKQRNFLIQQATKEQGCCPNLLSMTATPIPRTVFLFLRGNLDLSLLTEMPPGRLPPATHIIPPDDREKCYRWIKEQVKKQKTQVFLICPLVEPSETLSSVKAVKNEFVRLKKDVFPDLKLALLYGKMTGKDKTKILRQMQKGKIDVLVSTPVVEVGVDIPRASIMLVEGAERFGLAQLHQFRGRVGRRGQKSYCFLFSESHEPKIVSRLKYLEKIHSGIKLAEIDLRLRGPGEIWGVKQHGFLKLKLASLSDNILLGQAKEAAEWIFRQSIDREKMSPCQADRLRMVASGRPKG